MTLSINISVYTGSVVFVPPQHTVLTCPPAVCSSYYSMVWQACWFWCSCVSVTLPLLVFVRSSETAPVFRSYTCTQLLLGLAQLMSSLAFLNEKGSVFVVAFVCVNPLNLPRYCDVLFLIPYL